MNKVYLLREKYIGFSFVTLAATEEGYSLYKRNQFEDLDADTLQVPLTSKLKEMKISFQKISGFN